MYVYILFSEKYRKTYVGITGNLSRRLKDHNSSKQDYSKKYIPWKIIYHEKVGNRQDARKKEKYLKSSAGRRWMKQTLFNKL